MSETTKKIELSRRAVAAMRRLGLEMRPGMRATWPDDSRPARRYGEPGQTGGWVSDYSGKERSGRSDEGAILDFDDAATRGCMLDMVREAMPGVGTGQLHARPTRDGWAMFACGMEIDNMRGTTEAEALVAALEAAGGAS